MPPITALVLSAVMLTAESSTTRGLPPTPTEIAQAITDLGDESYAVRERASQFLWQAGEVAEPALQAAIKSDDVEVVVRARRILHNFRYGIYPDTPPDTVQLIDQFRFGNKTDRQGAIDKLLQAGNVRTALKLVNTDSSGALRRQISQALVKDADNVLSQALRERNWTLAEQLLELGAVEEDGIRAYVTYLAVRGRLDVALARLQNKKSRGTLPPEASLTLIYLLRANGDLPAAIRVATTLGNRAVLRALLLEQGAWDRLTRIQPQPIVDLDSPFAEFSADKVEAIGYAVAFRRLADKESAADALAGTLKQFAAKAPKAIWPCTEALLVNDRYDDAVEVLRRSPRHTIMLYDLHCAQLRYRAALALAGIESLRGPHTPWFNTTPPGDAEAKQARLVRFQLGLAVVKTLEQLGEHEAALAVLNELAEAARYDQTLRLINVCETASKAGLRDETWQFATEVIEASYDVMDDETEAPGGDGARAMNVLFTDKTLLATRWWTFLRARRNTNQPVATTLQQLTELLGTAPENDATIGNWNELVGDAAVHAKSMNADDRASWLRTLAGTCRLHGDRDAALEYLKQEAELKPTYQVKMQIADALAEDRQWKTAAKWYQLAAAHEPVQPIAVYMHGYALKKVGNGDDGEHLMELACLLPLANDRRRYYFGKQLSERNLTNDATTQWQLVLRTGDFDSATVNEAAKQLGNRMVAEDPGRAAVYWQRGQLSCLKSSRSISHIQGYLTLGYLIHKLRGRGFLALGQLEQAIDQWQLSQQAMPGNIQLVLDIVPLLEQHDQQEAADALFENAYVKLEEVCRDFPRSALHYNNLAWMAARCGRQFDVALSHAQRAVELQPDNPMYLDTLAEVYFAQGNREKAQQLAQQCMAMDSKSKHYREQMDRFSQPEGAAEQQTMDKAPK